MTRFLFLLIATLLACSTANAQTVKVSALPAATSAADADLTMIVQGGVSKKATLSLLRQTTASQITDATPVGRAILSVTNPSAIRFLRVNADNTVTLLDAAAFVTAIGSPGVTDGDKGDVTVTASGVTWTIDANVVDLTKLADVATDRLIGRDTAGTGDPEALTVGGGIEFTGSGGIQTSAFTGDATKAAGGTSTTIANDAVTFAKFQNISTGVLLGRATASSGDTEEISLGVGLSNSGGTLNPGVKGADIASAATVDLATATGDFIDITGTTGPITSFGTVAAGREFTLRFISTPTITHNATSLILPGSVSIIAVANDRAILRSLGAGNWIVIDYIPATVTGTGGQVRQTAPFLLNAVTIGSGTFADKINWYNTNFGVGLASPGDVRFYAVNTTSGWKFGTGPYSSFTEYASITAGGELRTRSFVSPKATTPITLVNADTGTVYTNEGAAAKIFFNLPTAATGLKYTFLVQDADGIQVVAAAGDTIRIAGSVSAAAGNIDSTTIGSTVTLVAINATEWIAFYSLGTWVVTWLDLPIYPFSFVTSSLS